MSSLLLLPCTCTMYEYIVRTCMYVCSMYVLAHSKSYRIVYLLRYDALKLRTIAGGRATGSTRARACVHIYICAYYRCMCACVCTHIYIYTGTGMYINIVHRWCTRACARVLCAFPSPATRDQRTLPISLSRGLTVAHAPFTPPIHA